MTFKELGIIEPILKALAEKGYTQPTPIQAQAIPVLLAGKDLLGSAQTGTGKTAAFTIPILQHLAEGAPPKKQRKIQVLIITPTRELAIQIDDNVKAYAKYTDIRSAVIFGGVKQASQVRTLKNGVDVLTATPGRLLDLINQGFVSLKNVNHFVLDEADQMLDMGFVHDIKKLLKKLPQERQSLFFSATMPKSIIDLSKQILGNFERVNIAPQQTTAERVDQAIYFVPKKNKTKLLVHLLKTEPFETVLVFSRTKHGANKIVKKLSQAGIQSAAIHGNKSQNQRQKVLNGFKDGKINVLVATDIAARGIDVSQLSLVVQFDLPNIAETYVHRIGRTGRAKASGSAIAFCDQDERSYLKSIEKLIEQRLPVVEHEFNEEEASVAQESSKPSKPKSRSYQPNTRRTGNSRNKKKSN
ncbi:DEAD/DEAH box helicase [Mesonia aestuariivivens]|uniref:DEAD/DEAH box helicase n=1 Tax=Mesonia aestuariivivens TaxID=2796128 RepID=A0ABS6W043_9FLAO|nr:DEAD/DEAH box helicase [Mesonia aestuariivivens]MBW2960494.1 DEAD/DEAH box helicase [Mesonia aestuariivivens]